MSMIFPGMDPYLEDARGWCGVHNAFIVYLADHLQPSLRPRYIAAVEERVFVEGPDCEVIPDVWLRQTRQDRSTGCSGVSEDDGPILVHAPALEVHESYLTILDRQSRLCTVTVIELVSPANKYLGPGRASHVAKQKEVSASETHLVEIDLLRTGRHVLAVPENRARKKAQYDYLISVNRAKDARDWFEIYPRSLRQRLPRISVPLAGDDPDVKLDLQAVLAQTYELGTYRERIDYSVPCDPPLSTEDQAWADGLARQRNGEASQN